MKYQILQDLEKLSNPEKSRNFATKYWESNLLILKDIFNRIQKEFRANNPYKISVIGTNGKGTVSYFLAQLFYYKNKSVGLYTSPHLYSFTERISINLKNPGIDYLEKEYREFINKIYKDIYKFSYFEFLTIFSIYLFYKNNLKIHIYEAGLGGRLDATSIVEPETVILTTIRMDHQHILGNTYEKILREKLGIIKSSTKYLLIFDKRLKKFTSVFDELRKKNPLLEISFFEDSSQKNYIENFKKFSQFCYFKIEKEDPKNYELLPPSGRMEIYKTQEQFFIYDCAHNPSAFYYLWKGLLNQFNDLNNENTVLFLGLLKDRNYKYFLKILQLKELQSINIFIIHKSEFIHHNIEKMKLLWNPEDYKLFNEYTKNKKYILFTGSFRIYDIYLNIIKHMRGSYV